MSTTGVTMSVVPTPPERIERLERWPMSLAEYLALPEGVRAEYVNGEAVVTPPATSGHNKAQRRIANAIEAGLAEAVDVRTESGWAFGELHRIPDVAVFAHKDDVVFDANVPILVVEVLSPSTASEDTVRKATEYLAAGISQYWIVDRAEPSLIVYGNNGQGWDRVAVLDADNLSATITVGAWGEVSLDLLALLRP
ncbi:Uma2 family endonuclease [Nocardioides sp. WS12]|uniref:Uma2 family endonuclease n=1 Tax=Nocardioides sp. WS12 TaxID=2486272 RepID=UPI0015F8EFE6|nr:Uma2 family endonuclease [Nocardioides sp. WS12]